ncbi:MAG: thiamine phosphate synthase [Filomicrobium sp.]
MTSTPKSSAKAKKTPTTGEPARILLALPLTGELPSPEHVGRLVAETEIPSVLLTLADSANHNAADLKPLVAVLQHNHTAVLIGDNVELATDVSADGVHLSRSLNPEDEVLARYSKAREALGPNAIVGVEAGPSRHDAMTLGEAGADYVAFNATGDEAQELISWWAEIFEPPVVALGVSDVDEACELASIGADFVELTLPTGLSPADELDWLNKANAALATIRD